MIFCQDIVYNFIRLYNGVYRVRNFMRAGVVVSHMNRESANRSTVIGAGIGIGMGIGAGWGIMMAQVMGSEVLTGLVIGAGTGLVIALISGAVVYHTTMTE